MIEFREVTKNYGKTTALEDFSIIMKQSGIHCLLGRNGAGKTTLLKMLAGHITSTYGAVLINGRDVSTLNMPDEVHFVESGASQFNMRLGDLFKAAVDINPLFDETFARKLAKRFKLSLEKRYKQLSFGMKVMVNTLIAMSSGKEILLLDEPVLGFDPVMRKTFYDLLQESCKEKPQTVIVSTHIIDEIARVVEQLIIIDKGRMVLFCNMNEVDEKAYCVTGPVDHVTAATNGINVISETRAGGFLSRYIYDRRIGESDKYSISALGLQDFFIGLVGDEKEGM